MMCKVGCWHCGKVSMHREIAALHRGVAVAVGLNYGGEE
jgi:hypothetical protein